MRTSLLPQKPKPVTGPTVDKIAPPGRIGLLKPTTFVMSEGDIEIMSAHMPGVRKHVVALKGGTRIVGDNMEKAVSLKEPGDAVLLEFTGKEWKPLYTVKGDQNGS